MTMLLAWAVLPLVLGVLTVGCGLLVEWASGQRLPGVLLAPVGFALLVSLCAFPPVSGTTARLAVPLVVVAAAAGYGLTIGRWQRPLRIDPWPWGAAALTYVIYALPVVASGRATFAGYIKLDDTATYLAMLDRIQTHGRDLSGLAPSSYEATLATSLDYGYPVGSFAPIGVVHQLLGVDTAWLWQPYIAFLAPLLALALYHLAGCLVASRAWRATIAVVAAQPALLFGYYLWGGIKELAAATLIATLAGLVGGLRRGGLRAVIGPAVATAAVVNVLSVGGAFWLALPPLAVLLVWRERGTRFALQAAGVFSATTLALVLPSILAAIDWLPRSKGFAHADEFGNLIRPLKLSQVIGIWPSADFRVGPDHRLVAYLLMAVAVALAVYAVVVAVQRRSWELLLFVATAAVGAVLLQLLGSPWVSAKGLATASPAVIFLALLGAALVVPRIRAAGIALAVVVILGVAWSNVLAYREVWLAPNDRLGELERIGRDFAGQGPALMTEFESYGARHFLRRLDAEGASELRRNVIPLRTGQPVPPQQYADIDLFPSSSISPYRLLVLRHSPASSLPPSGYRLARRYDAYDVWVRDDAAPPIVDSLPLGSTNLPAGVPACADVRRLAAEPGVASLVAVQRPPVLAYGLGNLDRSASWDSADDGAAVNPTGSGAAEAVARIAEPGSYRVWVGGSFVGRLAASVDGRRTGTARHELQWPGQFVELGTADLARGEHRLRLDYDLGGLRPGSSGLAPFPLGPLVLERVAPPRVVEVPPSAATSLCGREWDWIEAHGR